MKWLVVRTITHPPVVMHILPWMVTPWFGVALVRHRKQHKRKLVAEEQPLGS